MAFDQSKAFTKLESIIDERNTKEFIYDFLLAFGSPKATITKLKNNLGSSGSVLDNELILKNKIFYLTVETGTDLHKLLEAIKSDTRLSKDKIRFVLLTDFEDVLAYDLKAKDLLDIEFIDLAKNYAFFLPLAGIEKYQITSEHPADVRASYKMGQLCDVLRRTNDIDTEEKRHAFNVFLTRLLFCFYSEDTGIFDKNQMVSTITNTTDKSGKDLQDFFHQLFHVLNCPPASSDRQTLPNHISVFPYVNGGLFARNEWIPEFNNKARRLILEIGALEWNEINPDIFGSMFQAVIDPEQRGSLGQHYTSVPNIMKVIEPLFLNDLREELNKSRKSPNRLKKLLLRLQRIWVFDPACGSGNFLIIGYKELRLIEIDIFKALNELQPQGVMFDSGISVSQFYGIEIDDFAHEIALLSLWLAENQMNTVFEKEFGYREPMLPLKSSGNIVCGNALTLDWTSACSKHGSNTDAQVYICGNPPFIGKKEQGDNQKQELKSLFGGSKTGLLDYVSGWYLKSLNYMHVYPTTEAAFVSTNSITQGEQVEALWSTLVSKGVRINFAHRTFEWQNSARQKAAVHCVIIGFSLSNRKIKKIFNYSDVKNVPYSTQVTNINPYLIDHKDVIVRARMTPLSDCPKMIKGNEATDNGNLILNRIERDDLLSSFPEVESWIRPFLGGKDFLNGAQRWCLWLADVPYSKICECEPAKKRIMLVKEFRQASTKQATRDKALTPWLFGENRQPRTGKFILTPKVSSIRRSYTPIDFVDSNTIINNTTQFIPLASLYHFAIIQSSFHMAWLDTVGGRMKSDYQYSIKLVYNTFSWPDIIENQKQSISSHAEDILLAREDHPDKTLAQMYNPETMPPELLAAHQSLDRAVDKLYRDKPFENASERLEFLFKRYEQLIAEEANNA